MVQALEADYWKPIQTGQDSDRETVKSLVPQTLCHPELYHLKQPLSPHYAAHLEGFEIDPSRILPPKTKKPLIIESCGGVLVPLTKNSLTMDVFKQWDCLWFLVSRHYLGSLNHTLLTLQAMQNHNCKLGGIIFNGHADEQLEEPILHFANSPKIFRLFPENEISSSTIKKYAQQWKPSL